MGSQPSEILCINLAIKWSMFCKVELPEEYTSDQTENSKIETIHD